MEYWRRISSRCEFFYLIFDGFINDVLVSWGILIGVLIREIDFCLGLCIEMFSKLDVGL